MANQLHLHRCQSNHWLSNPLALAAWFIEWINGFDIGVQLHLHKHQCHTPLLCTSVVTNHCKSTASSATHYWSTPNYVRVKKEDHAAAHIQLQPHTMCKLRAHLTTVTVTVTDNLFEHELQKSPRPSPLVPQLLFDQTACFCQCNSCNKNSSNSVLIANSNRWY